MSSSTDPTGDSSATAPDDETRKQEDVSRGDGVSLVDVLLVLVREKRFVVWAVAVFFVLGLSYAILKPPEYTSRARVLREVQEDGFQGLSGGIGGLSVLQGLGISLGGGASGLTPEAYPDILMSREVRLAVIRDTFYFPELDQRMSFVEYTTRSRGVLGLIADYTVRLPWTLKRQFGDLISESPRRAVGRDSTGAPVYPTRTEEEAMETIGDMTWWAIDPESGIMTIAVTAGGPSVAAQITQSFLSHLRDRVRSIRTEKAKQNLEFIRQRFEEAKERLRAAEEKLAQFTDRNKQINSAQLRTERDRLQRQVTFASDLYSQLQSRKTQAEIELQRSEPVVTVVEEPVPPIERSAPRRTLLVLLSLIVGGVVGVGGAFVRWSIRETEREPEGRRKLEEIKEAVVPERWR